MTERKEASVWNGWVGALWSALTGMVVAYLLCMAINGFIVWHWTFDVSGWSGGERLALFGGMMVGAIFGLMIWEEGQD
jgi:hypothetical protein